MSRPVDWSPLAAADPVPGDPDRVEQLGRHYRRVADAIRTAATKLRRIAGDASMDSDAVDQFRSTARKVADDIDRAHERYAGVGEALSTYAPALLTAQTDSLTALRAAQLAQAELATATRQVTSVRTLLDGAPPGADTTGVAADHRRARVAATAASDALERARRRLDDVVYARNESAQRATRLIEDVRSSGDLSDGWWDNWGAKIVKAIVEVAEIVALVAGALALLLGWVPVLGQFLAAVALTASVIVLVGQVALALTTTPNGRRSSARPSAWRRSLPGQTLDDARNIRNFDWRHPATQVQAEGRPNVMSFLGERGAADDLREIGKIHAAVRSSEEVRSESASVAVARSRNRCVRRVRLRYVRDSEGRSGSVERRPFCRRATRPACV